MNIIEAGAVPDGKTDCSKAFAASLLSGYAEIPPGQFYVSQPIVIPSNSMLRGCGPSSVIIGILEMNGVNSIFINDLAVGSVSIHNASYRIRTSNLIVEGSLLSGGVPYRTPCGIKLANCYMIYFDRPQIRNCAIGIQITNDPTSNDTTTTVNALTITGGEIQQNMVGMDVIGAFGVSLAGMTIQGQVQGGLLLRSLCHGFSIRDCYFESNVDNNPQFYDIDIGSTNVCYSVTIDTCWFISSSTVSQPVAIRSQKCSGLTFEKSLVWGYSKAGLLTVGPSGFLNGLVQQVQASGGIPAHVTQ